MASKGLYANINARKKAGTSRSKSESTISSKSYKNMQEGFPKKKAGGYVLSDDNKRRKKEFGGSKAVKNNMRGHKNSLKAGGMLKAVPEDKKKSLGKLPTPVREKMGFMKEGGNVKRGLRPPLNKRSRRKFTGRKLEGPPPKKQTRSEKRGGVPTEEQRLRMESGLGSSRRRKRGVPTSDLGGSRMRASKGAEQPRSRSALAELGGEKIERKPMKEGGMVIVDRQYLKGK